jgi:putative membrane protein
MEAPLAHWSASGPLIAGYAAIAVAHVLGRARLARRAPQGRGASLRHALVFHAGLLMALLALISPLAHYAGIYLWARAIQDVLLAFVAPALVVVGSPWPALRASLSPGSGGGQHDEQQSGPRLEPAAAALALNLVWLGWHLPWAFDLATRSGAARAVQEACFLVAGVTFWMQLAGPRARRPTISPLRRLALLAGTVALDTLFGIFLVFGSTVLYGGYANHAHRAISVLADQQLAGAVLWVGVLPPLVVASVALLLRWLNEEEADAVAKGLDRLLRPRTPTSGWASRSQTW